MEKQCMVAEWCQNCGNEIYMKWDVKKLGYKAFCPVCGKILMLCDECLHTEGLPNTCDYNTTTDSCKFSGNPVFAVAV